MKRLSKKFLSLFLILALTLTLFAGCANNATEPETETENEEQTVTEKVNVNLAALKGPTGMGMVKLMEDNENGTALNNYNVTLAGAPDEIAGKIINGELDIAAVPINLASTLYNKTEGKVSVICANTLNVIYLLTKGEEITSIADLKGKTIYSSGQGTTPEYLFNYILEQNGIDPVNDVTIEYKTENAEVVTAMASNENAIGVLPQPFVTSATAKNPDIKVSLDLTEEYLKVADDKAPVIGVIIVRNEFLENNKEAVDNFLSEYQSSTTYVNENLEESSALIEKYGILAKDIAKIAIPKCNIVFIEGSSMKTSVSSFLEILFNNNPSSVGGKLPSDDFYYEK